MKIDLTPVFQAIIALLAALITYKLIPWIKARTTKNQQDNLAMLCRTLVYAAEQIFGSGTGKDKMQYVLDALEEAGYDVDSEKIKAAIECAVREMNIYDGPVKLPETIHEAIPVDLEITHWSLEQLKLFCDMNNIDAIGCVTREDYMEAIERGGTAMEHLETEPPTEGGAD
ncbi:MAG: hypothetical protein IJ523_10665 [Succinivibrionaceae bacterium]|nr:hypothetical protein [Succinivibrionaceae bacterium]